MLCGGKINNANAPYDVKFPYLIPKTHYFTKLVYGHPAKLHNGVRETVNFISSQYSIMKHRNFIEKIIHECSTCKHYEGKPYSYPEEPPLLKRCVSKDHVFSYIGIDYAGSIYINNVYDRDFNMYNACIVIVTCSSSRALCFDVVKNCSSALSVNMLKRSISQNGAPKQVLWDKGSTFARKVAKEFISLHCIKWSYKIAQACWTGGFFEGAVSSVKRCLEKMLEKTRVRFDELLTI